MVGAMYSEAGVLKTSSAFAPLANLSSSENPLTGSSPYFPRENSQSISNPYFSHVAIHEVVEEKGVRFD